MIQEEATVETLKKGNFDAVIAAVGAEVKKPDVPGLQRPLVADAMEVLQGKVHLGQRGAYRRRRRYRSGGRAVPGASKTRKLYD